MAGEAACVHTLGGRAGALRCAVHGVAGKAARRARRRPCVCKRGTRVCKRGVRGARGSAARAGGPACGRAPGAGGGGERTHLGSSSRLPAGLPQRARPGAQPGGGPQSHPCSVARRPPRSSAAPRAGGSGGPGGGRELRRSPGTLPGARRALPRAPRPPAPCLI